MKSVSSFNSIDTCIQMGQQVLQTEIEQNNHFKTNQQLNGHKWIYLYTNRLTSLSDVRTAKYNVSYNLFFCRLILLFSCFVYNISWPLKSYITLHNVFISLL